MYKGAAVKSLCYPLVKKFQWSPYSVSGSGNRRSFFSVLSSGEQCTTRARKS